MNANELADAMEEFHGDPDGLPYLIGEAATMLRLLQKERDLLFDAHSHEMKRSDELQIKLDAAEQVIQSIANEQIELSHDKIKWQNEDHIRWCKKFIEEYNK